MQGLFVQRTMHALVAHQLRHLGASRADGSTAGMALRTKVKIAGLVAAAVASKPHTNGGESGAMPAESSGTSRRGNLAAGAGSKDKRSRPDGEGLREAVGDPPSLSAGGPEGAEVPVPKKRASTAAKAKPAPPPPPTQPARTPLAIIPLSKQNQQQWQPSFQSTCAM